MNCVAMGTWTPVTLGGSHARQRGTACLAMPWVLPIPNFGERTTRRANIDVLRMSPVLCQEIAGKEVHIFAALVTFLRFDPEKIFHFGIWLSTVRTLRSVQ
jgi:hypothetical protein